MFNFFFRLGWVGLGWVGLRWFGLVAGNLRCEVSNLRLLVLNPL